MTKEEREMVEAVRKDSVVGRDTCSCIDECMTDEELIEEIKDLRKVGIFIFSGSEAVQHFRKQHEAYLEREKEIESEAF